MIIRTAVNKILLWQANKCSMGNEIHSLQGTGGGKSPAASTVALILDTGHRTLGPPVHTQWQRFWVVWLIHVPLQSCVPQTVVSLCLCGHFVVHLITEFVCLNWEAFSSLNKFDTTNHEQLTINSYLRVLFVVMINLGFVFQPNPSPEALLLIHFVNFSMLKLPCLKIWKILQFSQNYMPNMNTSHSERISLFSVDIIVFTLVRISSWLKKIRK